MYVLTLTFNHCSLNKVYASALVKQDARQNGFGLWRGARKENAGPALPRAFKLRRWPGLTQQQWSGVTSLICWREPLLTAHSPCS